MTVRRDGPWYQWLLFGGQALAIHGIGLGIWSYGRSSPPSVPRPPLSVMLVSVGASPSPPPSLPEIGTSSPSLSSSLATVIRRSPPPQSRRSPVMMKKLPSISAPVRRSSVKKKPLPPVRRAVLPPRTSVAPPMPLPAPAIPEPLPPPQPELGFEPLPTPPPLTDPASLATQGRVSFGSLRLSQPDRDLPDQWAQPLGDPPAVALPPGDVPWVMGQRVTLEVLVVVHGDGSATLFPEKTRVLQGAMDPLSAGDWVRSWSQSWRFSPTLSAGQPVDQEYWVQLAIEAIPQENLSP